MSSVGTAACLGQAGDKGFFKSQAQMHIAHALELLYELRRPVTLLAVSELLSNRIKLQEELENLSFLGELPRRTAVQEHFANRLLNQPEEQLGGVRLTPGFRAWHKYKRAGRSGISFSKPPLPACRDHKGITASFFSDEFAQTLSRVVAHGLKLGVRTKPAGETVAVFTAQGAYPGVTTLLTDLTVLVALPAIKAFAHSSPMVAGL